MPDYIAYYRVFTEKPAKRRTRARSVAREREVSHESVKRHTNRLHLPAALALCEERGDMLVTAKLDIGCLW